MSVMQNIDKPVGSLGAVLAPDTMPRERSSLLEAIRPYVSIARPDHWFKNVFMALGVILAYFCHPDQFGSWVPLQLTLALIATCLVASSNYVINEILDAPTDRSHPVKRNRPIPSGRVNLLIAYLEWVLLGVVGLALAWSLNRAFFFSAAFLLCMGVVYNVPPVRSKNLPYLDVLSESINNPIRLLLGWFAIAANEFPPASLLLSYWFIGAFFMASKRFSEYRMISSHDVAGRYRASFHYYDEKRLLISMFFYVTCFALFMGIFIIRYHLELILIVPLVAGFVSYYLHVAFKQDSAAQAPEKLYREKGLVLYLILCVVAFTVLMFVQIPALYDVFNVTPSQAPPLWKF
jgi:4-hydroxybenzoate polyprenyltransferase